MLTVILIFSVVILLLFAFPTVLEIRAENNTPPLYVAEIRLLCFIKIRITALFTLKDGVHFCRIVLFNRVREINLIKTVFKRRRKRRYQSLFLKALLSSLSFPVFRLSLSLGDASRTALFCGTLKNVLLPFVPSAKIVPDFSTDGFLFLPFCIIRAVPGKILFEYLIRRYKNASHRKHS